MKNNMLKTSYIMLSISAIISFLFSIGVIGLLIFLTTMGISDSNGGGWLIFFAILIGFAGIQYLIMNGIHIFTWIVGLIFVKKNQFIAKVFGIISTLVNFIGNFLLTISSIALAFSSLESVMDILAIGFWGLPTLYYGIILICFIMSKTKNASVMTNY